MVSFTRSIDLALRALLFSKFAGVLGIDQSGTSVENINKGIVQTPKEIALREIAEKRGEDFLEFMNFWRMGTSPSMGRQRTPVARRGFYVADTTSDKIDIKNVKAIPVDLNYNVWFWSKSLDKVYQCIEEYLFWQQDNPNLTLSYDTDYALEFDLHFGEIVDESSISEKYSSGIIFVYKLPIKIEGWIFKSSTSKVIQKIILTEYNKDDVDDYSEIVVEDSNQDTELTSILKMFREKLYGILEITSPSTITIPGNFASDFNVGDKIVWENSTSNNGIYTIVSVIDVGNNTDIVVSESIPSDVVIGNIYKREL